MSKDEAKADRALALLGSGGTISVQVLNEAASVARRKLGCDWQQIADLLGMVRGLSAVCPLTIQVNDQVLRLAARYGLPINDALIAASALNAGCTTLWSEDFRDGQILDGRLLIRNPFT